MARTALVEKTNGGDQYSLLTEQHKRSLGYKPQFREKGFILPSGTLAINSASLLGASLFIEKYISLRFNPTDTLLQN